MNYNELKELHLKGNKVAVNIEKRLIKVNGKPIDYEPNKVESDSVLTLLNRIESLYALHKHSIPNTEDTKREYFKALKYSQLSEDDKVYGYERRDSRFELEMFVLNAILTNELYWDEEIMGKWFWQSQADKDLIILRSWVEQ